MTVSSSRPYYIYIHIPFCLKKCFYCNFTSTQLTTSLLEKYITELLDEIRYKIEHYKINSIETIYIGGGTPSLLSVETLGNILAPFQDCSFTESSEITVEVNPKTPTATYFTGLKQLGINRLSLGVQSFDDVLLEKLGRQHRSKDVYACIQNARAASFDNISVDLMYGLPCQTLDVWKDTLQKACSLDVEHVSMYGLKIEEGTPFHALYEKDEEDLPDDQACEEMYKVGIKTLENCGFRQYEISNLSKPNKQSAHNLNYWQNGDYVGIGVAAHSHINQERKANTNSLELYTSGWQNGETTIPISKNDSLEEAIFLGLRLAEGINIEKINHIYNIDFLKRYETVVKKYSAYFNLEFPCLRLTTEGFLLSNFILSEFID